MADESINTIAGDEYLRPNNINRLRRVVLTIDDSQNTDESERLVTGPELDMIKSKTREEENESSESSRSFQDDYNSIRRTLDYDESSNSEIFDDPSVIAEADQVENAIRHNLAFVAMATCILKLFNKLMECLFGNDNVQQEIATQAMDDLTGTSVTNSSGVAGGGGGQSSAAAQAQ